jgi:uncharacterized protein (TIGR03437 family)
LKTFALLFTSVLISIPLVASPVIAPGGVVNAASFAAQGLPNAAIAKGSIFTIFGSGLGTAAGEYGFNYPLPTVTAGQVSVNVTVNGTTTKAIILYAGAGQVNAVLPSATPAGTGTVTVTYQGQTSAPAPIEVVASNFGTFAVNSAGSGPGIVTFADYSLVTVNKAANPGETLIIWGTGLGPVTGDEAAKALPGDLPSVPLEVLIGGVKANLTYRGRSGCCSGLDQVGAVVPQGVEGCSVPVSLKINDKVSNVTSIAVAAGGRTCTDSATGVNSAQFTSLFNKPNAAFGSIVLSRYGATTPGFFGLPATTITTDASSATFERFTFAPGTSFSPALFNSVSNGACTVSSYSGKANPYPGLTFTGLDAGASLSVSGSSGARTLTPLASVKGVYAGSLGDNYLDPGQYTVSGQGGADVGAFSAKLTLPQALIWTNESAVDTIVRGNGLVVTWTGGDPKGFVSIDGGSYFTATGNTTVGANFHCQAKTADGTFTVPAAVLLSLPASAVLAAGGISIPTGALSVASASTYVTFTASGLDLGIVAGLSGSSKIITYQ